MTVVSVLPLRLYRIAAEPLSETERQFYSTVTRLLFPQESIEPLVPAHTIPIDRRSCAKSKDVAAAISRSQPSTPIVPGCLIVDLTNPPYRLLPDHHIIGGLLAFLLDTETRGQLAATPVAVLMPVILADADITMRALKPYIDAGAIGLIADNGAVCGTWPPLLSFRGDEYARALKDIRQSPTWLLGKKMIRRPGHFKRFMNGLHDHCLPYFFDGSFCQDELIELIGLYATAAKQGERLPTLVYHCPESRWLYDAVTSICQLYGLDAYDAEPLLHDARDADTVPELSLVVVPLVDSTETLREILTAMLARKPECRVRVLAVMTTDPNNRVESEESFAVRGRSIPITYLLHAERPRVSPANCPACRIDLEANIPGQWDRYLKLTSHAMWNMLLGAGMKAEQDVPKSRPSLGPVPDLLKLVEQNSPYLALKIDTMLRSCAGGLPTDPIILHPLEVGANAIAESLASLYDYTLIAVPRSVLDALPAVGTVPTTWFELPERGFRATDEPWFVELSSLQQSGGIRAILMDEFNRSGQTRDRLERLARSFALEPWCYFCLIDFAPGGQQHTESLCLSLYDLELEFAD